jgi:hypothetical protein
LFLNKLIRMNSDIYNTIEKKEEVDEIVINQLKVSCLKGNFVPWVYHSWLFSNEKLKKL